MFLDFHAGLARVVCAATCTLAACAAAPPPVDPSPVLSGSRSCPLGVPGIVTIDDTPDGAAFTFTSRDLPGVEELRQRARDAAAIHGPGAHRGLGHEGVHGGGQRHGLALYDLPVRATVEDVESGARVRVSALDPAQVREVRAGLHARAERVASGECP